MLNVVVAAQAPGAAYSAIPANTREIRRRILPSSRSRAEGYSSGGGKLPAGYMREATFSQFTSLSRKLVR